MSWIENWGDEAPPQRIWLNDKAINAHFEALRRKREAERKGRGGSGRGRESIPDPEGPMLENDLFSDLED